MKTYVDFISDMIDDPRLYDELNEVLPFDSADALCEWFLHHGYQLSDADSQTLLENQRDTGDEDGQFHY